jgi:hypothetical protein
MLLSKKSPRIAELLADLPASEYDPHYLGYFVCFNRQLYFEAHDVLEQLWLAGGKTAPNYSFFKGLIQLAGAFVHLQKGRLRPAVALFRLTEANLSLYPPDHAGLTLSGVLELVHQWRGWVESGGFDVNPLGIHPAPRLLLKGVPLV